MLSVGELQRLLTGGDKLTFDDVKSIMQSARYDDPDIEDIEYANSLLRESGDYLPSHLLRVLIRAELSDEDATLHIKQNKEFFERLTNLLPTLIGYFKPQRPDNIIGVLNCIDDCHGDYFVSTKSFRKDRLLREAKQSLENALEAVTKATVALEHARRYLDAEYESYSALYFQTSSASLPFRHDVQQLIKELKVCSGVLNIASVNAESDEDQFYLSGNDKRRVLVGYAHMMSMMWNGPKLVTTPGSDFANLCSFLFEAVAGIADESLAGAINRYARSDERRKRDAEELEFEAEENNDDNFLAEKHAMKWSAQEIGRCRKLLDRPSLPDMARNLLVMKLNREMMDYEAARDTYGPRQVWLHQLNEEQLEKFRRLERLSPEIDRSLAGLDRELGKVRRTIQSKDSTSNRSDV